MNNYIFPFHKAFKMIALTTSLAIAGSASAQTLVTPYNTSTVGTWFTNSSAVVQTINTAGINYPSVGGPVPIFACVAWDGTTANSDIGISGTPINLTTSASDFPGTPNGPVDIALANDPTAGMTGGVDFIAVYAYPTSSGVEVDYYPFYQSSGVLTAGTGFYTSSTYSMAHPPAVVHVDVIANYGVLIPSGTGYPGCTDIVVTWDDPSGTGDVFASHVSLLSIPATLTAKTISSSAISPAVAGIERTISGMMPHQDQIALVTFTNSAGTSLFYKEWDISTNTLSLATTLDGGTHGSPITLPRIAAIDDYNYNATLSGHANYKVVAQVDSSSYNIIRSYDNTLVGGSPSFWSPSNWVTLPSGYSAPPYQHYTPSVAMGGYAPSPLANFDGSQYLINDYVHYATGTDILMMEPINDSISSLLEYEWAAPLFPLGYDYYWVSDSPALGASPYYPNAVSSPCNIPNSVGSSIIAWCVPDRSGSDIEYKMSPLGYAFRQGPDGPVSGPGSTVNGWQVFPNPAGNFIIVNNPGAAGIEAGYIIMDMAGKILLKGSLISGSQQLAIGNIATGNYILKLSGGDGSGQNYLITRQ